MEFLEWEAENHSTAWPAVSASVKSSDPKDRILEIWQAAVQTEYMSHVKWMSTHKS